MADPKTLTAVTGSGEPLTLTPGAHEVPLTSIRLRDNANTRPLHIAHVVHLAESIAVIGLLEPIIVDTTGALLAGGHRLAALQLLSIPDQDARRREFLNRIFPSSIRDPSDSLAKQIAHLSTLVTTADFSSIPVIAIDLTQSNDPHLALAIETAENAVRRTYTAPEIRQLAMRFEEAGYTASEGGKPREGEQTVMTALEAALGRSKRQIQRILKDEATEPPNEWEKAINGLRRAANKVISSGRGRRSDVDKAIINAASEAIKTINDKE